MHIPLSCSAEFITSDQAFVCVDFPCPLKASNYFDNLQAAEPDSPEIAIDKDGKNLHDMQVHNVIINPLYTGNP